MAFEDDPYRDEDGEPLMDYDDFGAGRDPSPEPHQDDGLEDNDDLRDRDQSHTPDGSISHSASATFQESFGVYTSHSTAVANG